MALKYPDILQSNNPGAYGIVPATEVSGHKQVANFTALYALADPILSLSGNNTDNDAIGQLWYVASEGKHYQLVDWANRKSANGWKVFKSGGGGGTIVFSGIITTEVTMETTTTAAPTDIYYYKLEDCFIAKDASGKYYYQWSENDAYGILSQKEFGLLVDGQIVPDWGRTYQNKADDSLWIYNSETSLGRPVRPRVAYGTCDTAANVAEKVITLHPDFADWKLEIGAEFVVKGTYTNSASNVTLNVNNTGAKQILYRDQVYDSPSIILIYENQLIRYVFDGTYYVWMGRSNENSYNPQTLGFGYGISETPAATAAKTATLAKYSLTKNGIVAVKFTNAVGTGATLNINSRGAKPIFYRGAAIVAGVIGAGDVATFIYDGTNYIYLGTDNALSRAGGKMTGGISWETGDAVVSTINADGYEYNSVNVVSMDNDGDVVVTGEKIAKKGGTSDQVLMADGSVAGTITTAWLEANLT